MLNYIILFFAGVVSGILSSLFGLGGGLTVVPALLLTLPFFHVSNSVEMHIAIGTSLAIMFVNSLNSARSHYMAGNLKWEYFKKIALYIIIGTIIGSVIAYFLPAWLLMLIFSLFLIVVIVKFIKHTRIKQETVSNTTSKNQLYPNIWQRANYGILTGIISACVGGGSSLIMIPFLKNYRTKMKQAVALATTFNILIAFVATLAYAVLGAHANNLPKHSTGFIFWPAFICIIIGSLFGVPLGTRLINVLNEKTASITYFILLILILFIVVIKYILTFLI